MRNAEYEDFLGFKSQHTTEGGFEYITISGLVKSSALGISSIEIRYEIDRVLVNIELAVANKGVGGNLTQKIKLPRGTDSVFFGEKRKLIWSRNDPSNATFSGSDGGGNANASSSPASGSGK